MNKARTGVWSVWAIIGAGAIGALAPGCVSGDGEGAGAPEPARIVLVRHAEKETGPNAGNDPALTEAGRQRAAALAVRMRNEGGLRAVVCTQFRRTRETAAPIAELCDAEIVVVEAGRDAEAHARAVAAKVRDLAARDAAADEDARRGGSGAEGEAGAGGKARALRYLYVGHSNTIGPVMTALGADASGVKIAETEYDGVWEVRLP